MGLAAVAEPRPTCWTPPQIEHLSAAERTPRSRRSKAEQSQIETRWVPRRVPTPGLIPRHAAAQVNVALADTRVVLISGARQAGKSTLVRIVAGDRLAERRDLDRAQDRAAATADLVGFVDFSELLAIDEIQRVPELLLAIKASVDENPRPGRFLLTGSSRLFGMVAAPDALPGRMETVELWPLSQGEFDDEPDGFIDATFAMGPGLRHESAVIRADYAARIVRGGLPEDDRALPSGPRRDLPRQTDPGMVTQSRHPSHGCTQAHLRRLWHRRQRNRR